MTVGRSGRLGWALPALAAVVLAIAGCGGGGDEPSGDGDGPAAREPAASPEAGPVGVHGRAPAAVGGIPSIVMLTPVEVGAPAPPSDREGAVVDQFGLAFSPRVLVVRAGTPVTFTNSEGALTHNVHVRSIEGDSTVFNGDAGPGDGIEVRLGGPGGYDVLCDMHPGMSAFVFSTDAPYAVAADPDGAFDAGRLPPGTYRVRLWTVESGFGEEREVRVGDGPTEIDLIPSDG